MGYRTATKVTFTPEFSRMTQEEQQGEQVAAMEIVTRNGGTFESILVMPSENAALTIVAYPDERSALKAEIQIIARGAYNLQAQSCFTLDEWTSILEEANREAVVTT